MTNVNQATDERLAELTAAAQPLIGTACASGAVRAFERAIRLAVGSADCPALSITGDDSDTIVDVEVRY
mgnify:CR=1 FL=1